MLLTMSLCGIAHTVYHVTYADTYILSILKVNVLEKCTNNLHPIPELTVLYISYNYFHYVTLKSDCSCVDTKNH